MKILIIGGSGQLSGRLAELAIEAGHEIWTLSRGRRPVPRGAHALTADRSDNAAVRTALQGAAVTWDAAIDCICMSPAQAQQDLTLLPAHTGRLIVVSTDSVYHPHHKQTPQAEDAPCYMDDSGYGAMKRRMEETFLAAGTSLRWTIFRPGHIFGPGFLLGCFPEHSRQQGLLQHIREDQPLRLVGGGKLLIHPIFVDDLALTMLDCIDNSRTHNQIFCIGGPEAIPNAAYYECIGRIVGHPVTIEAIPDDGYLEAHPEYSGHLCQRSYNLSKLRNAGVRMPCIPLEEGLRRHIAWLDGQEP